MYFFEVKGSRQLLLVEAANGVTLAEYMFRGNSRGGVITPRILGGVFTPRILGGVFNPRILGGG